ncbi:glycoside hydrolase family 32 protein [Romboutsia timonensis]|uniref:glycoside hydrolase family 32 protein n=1 Tax=Romboutsia timonensis TaxID=1776391 RepID=UPI000AE9154F|nr:glycoside hydrolase family 32 protein [Romboutsia timonensis]
MSVIVKEDKLKQANSYVKNNREKVDNTYRQKYHIMPPIGWMNDPNGFSYYNGEYHLFYQYNPYSSQWGPMHWKHIKSKDLVNWKDLDIAIAPDEEYDVSGCFSGSAIEKDGKMYLMYTGHQDPGGFENLRQVQCIAVSEDGINFTKYENNPVIDSTKLPKEAIIQDFRDPKVYKKGDKYYSVIGSRNLDDSGQILLYSSDDLLNWNYEGNILQSNNEFAKMWECPDLFELDNKDILIMSPQFLEPRGNKYWNLHSSSYMIGNLDYKNNKYNLEKVEEIDYGFDFYAPQTLIDNKGRRIMIAWMQMWDRKFPTNELGHNWAGCMTIPRELKLVDDKLYQLPVEELKVLRKNEVSYKDINIKDNKSLEGIKGQCIELELEVDMKNSNEFEILLMKGNNQETSIKYNKIDELLVFDRSKNGKALGGGEKEVRTYRQTEANLIDNKLKLNIFIDRMSVEIFINDGIKTMSSTVYPDKDSDNIEFYCDKEAILDIKKWDMEVK